MFFSSLTEWTPFNVLIRILISLLLGSLIGIDRGVKKRGAGSRTDAAVCLGSTLIMLTAQYMYMEFPERIDISRMASQVISGVGFLGAGSILVSRHQVKGLTSAAGVWVCACVGLSVGIGFIDGAVIVTLVLLFSLHVLPMIEERVYHYSRYMTLYIEVDDGKAVARLIHKIKSDGCKVDMYNVESPKAAGQSFNVLVTVCMRKNMNKDTYAQSLAEMDGVISVDNI